jgi:hypothetical protein
VPQHPKGMLPRVLLEHLLPPVVWMRTYIIKVMISGPGSLSQHTELIQWVEIMVLSYFGNISSNVVEIIVLCYFQNTMISAGLQMAQIEWA